MAALISGATRVHLKEVGMGQYWVKKAERMAPQAERMAPQAGMKMNEVRGVLNLNSQDL